MHVTDYLVIVHVYVQCHVLLLYMYMHMQCVYKSVNVTGFGKILRNARAPDFRYRRF